jgi:tetratricopeptide (TPR) repeat protein
MTSRVIHLASQAAVFSLCFAAASIAAQADAFATQTAASSANATTGMGTPEELQQANDIQIAITLGEKSFKEGKIDQAIQILQELVDQKRIASRNDIKLILAEAYAKKGDKEKAATLYREVMYDPKTGKMDGGHYPRQYMRFSILLCHLKEYDEAMLAYNTGMPFLEARSDSDTVWQLLDPSFDRASFSPVRLEAAAWAAMAVDIVNIEDTTEGLRKAIELRPNFAAAHLFYGKWLLGMRHVAKYQKEPERAEIIAAGKAALRRAMELGDSRIREMADERLKSAERDRL